MRAAQTAKPPVSLPLQNWVCVEWQFDGVHDEMRLWLDGKSVDALTVTKPQCGAAWPAPTFETLEVGWLNAPAEAAGPMEMWVDDVAVDPKPIGCDG